MRFSKENMSRILFISNLISILSILSILSKNQDMTTKIKQVLLYPNCDEGASDEGTMVLVMFSSILAHFIFGIGVARFVKG